MGTLAGVYLAMESWGPGPRSGNRTRLRHKEPYVRGPGTGRGEDWQEKGHGGRLGHKERRGRGLGRGRRCGKQPQTIERTKSRQRRGTDEAQAQREIGTGHRHKKRWGQEPSLEQVGIRPVEAQVCRVMAQAGTAWFQTLIVAVQQRPVLSCSRAQRA